MKRIHIIHVFIKAHTDNNIIKLDTINNKLQDFITNILCLRI